MSINSENIQLLRKYLGKTQKQFSEDIGVSQSVISKIEKGINPIDIDLLKQLSSKYGDSFFREENALPNLKVYYRKSNTAAKKYQDLFESRVSIFSKNILSILEEVELSKNRLPSIDLNDFNLDASKLANEIRGHFNLGLTPIDDLVKLLEGLGIIIHFYEFPFISEQNKNFDGVSFYLKGIPVILINSKIQNARKNFTLAHELCHLLIHNDTIIEGFRDIEKEANVFASEFIAPTRAIRSDLFNLSFEKLFYLKNYWKLSVGALLYKAKDISLNQYQYRRWVTRMAPYRKHEPQDINLENPSLLKRMFDLYKHEFSNNNENDFIKDLGINADIYGELYSTIYPVIERKSKLKLIL